MLMVLLRNRVRGLLNIRKPRASLRKGGKPPVGAFIVKDDYRMRMQAGLSNELWIWLQDQGWRETRYRPDRRVYRDVPTAWVTWLIDAPEESWQKVLDAATLRARRQPRAQIVEGAPAQDKPARGVRRR
jgi:hypothetical protein